MEKFKELGLGSNILKGISELGFEIPTPIQEKVISHLITGEQDLIGLAQTGTGKTAAFALPLLETVNTNSKKVQNLILAPTRELCLQIANNIMEYSKYIKGVKVMAVYGGENIVKQFKGLEEKPQILVATPGRILDLCRRNKVNLSEVNTVVLDEADEMLNMGFKDELDAIIEQTPEERRTLLFSATMPKEVARISKKYLKDPIEITDGKKNTGATNVSHEFHLTKAENRYKALKRVIDYNPGMYCIVFCRTRSDTKNVAKWLIQDGYNADALHGDLTQAARDSVMEKFRLKGTKLLVATDVASRGLDVSDLTHVINYNLPDDTENYTHRSGRTGRAGKKGVSVSLIHSREQYRIKDIEKKIKVKFEQKEIPHGKDICQKQFFNFIDRLENVEVNHDQIDPLLSDIYKKLEWMDREQLINHIVSLEFNRFLSYYKDAPDLNIKESSNRSDRKKGRKENEGEDRRNNGRGKKGSKDNVRFFINKGSNQNFSPRKILGIFNEAVGNKDIHVDNIDVMKKFSFFEVKGKYKDLVLDSFDKKLKKRGIVIEVANKKK